MRTGDVRQISAHHNMTRDVNQCVVEVSVDGSFSIPGWGERWTGGVVSASEPVGKMASGTLGATVGAAVVVPDGADAPVDGGVVSV